MATNFSPCKGSYVLNQFPSNVMFGMNGFHVSASGAIQGHHGPLVKLLMGFYSACTPKNTLTNTTKDKMPINVKIIFSSVHKSRTHSIKDCIAEYKPIQA